MQQCGAGYDQLSTHERAIPRMVHAARPPARAVYQGLVRNTGLNISLQSIVIRLLVGSIVRASRVVERCSASQGGDTVTTHPMNPSHP